jgi:hypothetical protein
MGDRMLTKDELRTLLEVIRLQFRNLADIDNARTLEQVVRSGLQHFEGFTSTVPHGATYQDMPPELRNGFKVAAPIASNAFDRIQAALQEGIGGKRVIKDSELDTLCNTALEAAIREYREQSGTTRFNDALRLEDALQPAGGSASAYSRITLEQCVRSLVAIGRAELKQTSEAMSADKPLY